MTEDITDLLEQDIDEEEVRRRSIRETIDELKRNKSRAEKDIAAAVMSIKEKQASIEQWEDEIAQEQKKLAELEGRNES